MLHVKLQVSPSKPTPTLPELHDIPPLDVVDRISHWMPTNIRHATLCESDYSMELITYQIKAGLMVVAGL